MAYKFVKDASSYVRWTSFNLWANHFGGSTNFVLSTWFRVASADAGTNLNRILSWCIASGGTGFALGVDSDGSVYAGARSISTDSFHKVTSNRKVSIGGSEWNHVRVVVQYGTGGSIQLFLNGEYDNSLEGIAFGSSTLSQTAQATDYDFLGNLIGTSTAPTGTTTKFAGDIAELVAFGTRSGTSTNTNFNAREAKREWLQKRSTEYRPDSLLAYPYFRMQFSSGAAGGLAGRVSPTDTFATPVIAGNISSSGMHPPVRPGTHWRYRNRKSLILPVGGATPVTASTSLSAAIQASGFQQSSLSAAIQAAQSAAASISVAVQAAREATASVNSAIQTQQTTAATVNSAIQVATSVQSALDAVLQIARTQTASLNSAILESHTDSASLNAYIQAGFTASASISSAIQAVNTGNASLDAVVQQALSGNASVSAAVLSSLTTNATVSAAVQRALSLTAAISAAVQVAGSASASLNTYIQAGTSASALISAAILEAKSATASLDSVISLSGAVSTSLGAVISSQLAISVATSAAIQDLRSAAATLSAYITDPLAVITNSEWWMYDMPVNNLRIDMPVNDLRYDF